MEHLLMGGLLAVAALVLLAAAVAGWEHHRRMRALRLELAVADHARREWQSRAQSLDDQLRAMMGDSPSLAAAAGADGASSPAPAAPAPTPPGQVRQPGQRPSVALPRGTPAVPAAAAAARAVVPGPAPAQAGEPSRWPETEPMVLVAQAAQPFAAGRPDFEPTRPMPTEPMPLHGSEPTQPMELPAVESALAPTEAMDLGDEIDPPAGRSTHEVRLSLRPLGAAAGAPRRAAAAVPAQPVDLQPR